MDINETLRLIRATLKQMQLEDGPVSAGPRPEFVQHARDLAEHFEALDEWLSKGGFQPDAWRSQQRGVFLDAEWVRTDIVEAPDVYSDEEIKAVEEATDLEIGAEIEDSTGDFFWNIADQLRGDVIRALTNARSEKEK